MRFIMSGFLDRAQVGGPITGSGPNFESAMALFTRRQKGLATVGKWRAGSAKWKKNQGKMIDPDWHIFNYGQGD